MRYSFATLISIVGLCATTTFAAPPLPLPQKCNAQDINITLPGRVYQLRVPRTDHNDTYTKLCRDIGKFDALRYYQGSMNVKCDDGSFQTPSQDCRVDEIISTCNITESVGVSKTELKSAYNDAGKSSLGAVILKELPDGNMAQDNVTKISVSCGSKYTSDDAAAQVLNEGGYDVSIPACSASSSGMCYLDPNGGVKGDNPQGADSIKFVTDGAINRLVDADGKYRKSSVIYVWNKGTTQAKNLPAGAVKFKHRYRSGEAWKARIDDSLPAMDIPGMADEATGCELKVSGAVSSYSASNPPQVSVGNDVLVFSVRLIGGSGGGAPPKIEYSGGPNAVTGVWSSPPVGVVSTVTATVETAVSKNKFNCKLAVVPQGKSAMIRLRRFGDCSYFNNLRSYYFMNSAGKGYQNSGYSKPLSLPGIPAKYGTTSAEVPIRGVLNAAAALSGELAVNSSGKVITPPIENRAYSKAVVVAKRFQANSTDLKTGDPLYYGILDLNDYSLTQLYKVDPTAEPDSEETVVFQAFLAASQPDGIRDLRGTAGGLPYYKFASTTSAGKPYDRVVPFMDDSCVPLFQVSTPKRSDKEMPAELTGTTQCMYSRPFKVSDLKAGRVDLTLLHLVPEHAHHQFPAELFKASSQPTCVAKNPSNQKECWDIKSSSFGVAANANPFSSHSSCRTVNTVWATQTATSTDANCYISGNSYVCNPTDTTTTVTIPITSVTYKASCPVLESAGECKQNLAIRFSGYNQMMIAGLGCSVKYDRAGELVAASLINSGVLPYTSALGGSAPKSYEQYPAGYGDKKGFACIPCRFANDAIAKGSDVVADTAVMPVDQDATSARKPVFSFNKLKAPAECVRDVTFEVRYFGSQECNGVSNPPGHMCSSSNLGGQSCSATDGKGSGNVAGKFTVPVCPNSGFESDNVSVSWSPLLVDAAGNGIEISRDAQYGVQFDILGNGTKRLIDWPVNTKEVAFLVLPNSEGKVQSIKELFGDYKAADGFDALGKHDKNKDKKINKDDQIFGSLRLWFDQNRNAVAEAGELRSLDDSGVETIYLEHRKITNRGTEGRTLSSVYYNSKYREYLNVGDYYFNDYSGSKKKKLK